MEYPVERDLDGIYFRVKRGDKYQSLCWTDLTADERKKCQPSDEEEWALSWWKTMAEHLTDMLRSIGDFFDIKTGDI